MKLYEISARYEQLLDQEEYTPEEMAELESLHSNVEDECIKRAMNIQNLEALASSVKNALEAMKTRYGDLYQKIYFQRIKLSETMDTYNLNKITKSSFFEIHLKKNPPKVDDFDSKLIPSAYWYIPEITPTMKINKSAIKKAIDAGLEVPGARLVSDLRIEFK